jgi:hypothetical protein
VVMSVFVGAPEDPVRSRTVTVAAIVKRYMLVRLCMLCIME